jgi:hypothetical protein
VLDGVLGEGLGVLSVLGEDLELVLELRLPEEDGSIVGELLIAKRSA